MRLPRDLGGRELARRLAKLGYGIDHETGSHLRLTSHLRGEHHVTIPDHEPLKVGTLSAILRAIALHHALTRDELLRLLLD